MSQFETKDICFCFDSASSLRKEIYPEYKSNRKASKESPELTSEQLEELKLFQAFRKQVSRLRKGYLPAIGFRNIFRAEGYEADDIIASLCETTPSEKKVIIVSADHDLYQLLSGSVSIWQPRKGKLYTLQSFKNEFGILPNKWALVKAIAGCSSDTIPGVPRVGEKTAIRYLNKDLKEDSKAWRSIEEHKELWTSTYLPLTVIPFEGCPFFNIRKNKFSESGWKSVLKQLGLKSLRKNTSFLKGRKNA